eukprot:RCo044876
MTTSFAGVRLSPLAVPPSESMATGSPGGFASLPLPPNMAQPWLVPQNAAPYTGAGPAGGSFQGLQSGANSGLFSVPPWVSEAYMMMAPNPRAGKLVRMLERPRVPQMADTEEAAQEWKSWAQAEQNARKIEVLKAIARDQAAGRPSLPLEHFQYVNQILDPAVEAPAGNPAVTNVSPAHQGAKRGGGRRGSTKAHGGSPSFSSPSGHSPTQGLPPNPNATHPGARNHHQQPSQGPRKLAHLNPVRPPPSHMRKLKGQGAAPFAAPFPAPLPPVAWAQSPPVPPPLGSSPAVLPVFLGPMAAAQPLPGMGPSPTYGEAGQLAQFGQ